MLRCRSYFASGDAPTIARTLLSSLKQSPPSFVLWLADTPQPGLLAKELAGVAPAVVGGVSRSGLIGGGAEREASDSGQAVALAVTLPESATATAFHSPPHGLPDLDAATWEAFVTAQPANSPHMLLMGAPPSNAAFPVETFLSTLDRALPWATKVGGLLAGDSRLFVGETEHDGGVVGLALRGVALDALVCQGASPIGPSFAITAADSRLAHLGRNSILALDGQSVGEHEGLHEALALAQQAGLGPGTLMAGISVGERGGPAAVGGGGVGGGGAARETSGRATQFAPEYVMRPITGYSRQVGALSLGAAAELLEAPGARLQLHRFSATAARDELQTRAAAYAAATAAAGAPPAAGGLHVSCFGRGASLFGAPGVETSELSAALGTQTTAGLAGWFAGGEIGPVGHRTFVHTYTASLALLREE